MTRLKEFDPHEKLDKAKELFGKQGYHATSMQDLVDNLKISRSSMYDTFRDKHKLFIDCLQSYITETLNDYKAIISGVSAPMLTIERIVFRVANRTFEAKNRMVVRSIFEMAPLYDDIKKILKDSTDELVGVFKGLLLNAQDQGEFKPDRNINETAIFIVASFAGFYQMQVLYDNKKMLDQMATDLIRYLQ